MKVEIIFHGPFRISTGSTRDGVAATVDHHDPIPASSLKGLMRASAALLLPRQTDLVDEVFGHGGPSGRRHASPWHWGSATADHPVYEQRARLAIDPATGAGRPGYLFLGEEVWARSATFEITRHRPLDADILARHHAVLACAAAGVHALGSDRRRGLGWVTLRPTDPALDEELLATFEALGPGSTPARGGQDA